jgi:hypothetical protein
MKLSRLPGVVVLLVLACSFLSAAQEKGNWRASSSSAESITGDIAISDTKLSINFIGFPIAQIRRLEPTEIGAVFNDEVTAGAAGNLYRLNIPAEQRFLRHNTLCGTDDTEWMATYVQGHNLRVAFFSGPSMPSLTPEAVANATNLCGTFSYAR